MELLPEEGAGDERPLADVAAAGRHVARQCTVLIQDEGTGQPLPDPQYPVGIFEVPGAVDEGPILCAVISICVVEGRLLVAVPHRAWNRTTRLRVLPQNALSKATVVEVPFENRSADMDPGRRKIWLGFLAGEFEQFINFETPVESSTLDYPFAAEGHFVLPLSDALADYAAQFIPFESALSSAGGAGGSVEQRLGKLERSMAEIADSLKRLAPPSEAPAARPSALRSSPKYSAKSPKDQSTPLASRVEGMDLEVLRSAREAGVPDSQISQMLELASKGKPQLTDVPPPRKKVSILSDSEEEDEEELQEATDTAASGGESKVLVSAVSKLTKIASQLAARRKKDRSLEGVLDGVGSGASESSGLTGTRRHAAALRALRAALQRQPEELYKVLEANLEKDFNVVNQVPGSASVQVTARAWLEMRSHVQNFQTPARLLWGGSRRFGLHASTQACRGSCPTGADVSSRRSVVNRPRQLVDCGRDDVGGWTSAGNLQSAHAASGARGPIHQFGGWEMGRPLCGEVEGFRRAGREKEKAHIQEESCSTCLGYCPKRRSKGQGKRQGQRRWWQSRSEDPPQQQ